METVSIRLWTNPLGFKANCQ